jgi:hypothetical protein
VIDGVFAIGDGGPVSLFDFGTLTSEDFVALEQQMCSGFGVFTASHGMVIVLQMATFGRRVREAECRKVADLRRSPTAE